MSFLPNVPLFPLAFATLLSVHGLRKKSLSPNGSATAFVVGLGMMAGGVRVFGWALVLFYFTGSRATKYGKQRKAQLEDGYHEAGYRSGWQVLSNSFAAFVSCVIWNILFSQSSLQATIAGQKGQDFLSGHFGVRNVEYGDGSEWCPVDDKVASGWSRTLVFAALGHFACCLGDTLASELGILSKSKPRLITTLKPVPPGTNGGMSTMGTAASIAGGCFMGLVMSICLIIESNACRESAANVFTSMVTWGALGGGIGSLLDSSLGATIQETRYSTEKKRILQDDSKAAGQVVSGINILTNNQVNVLSSILTAVWIGLVG